jgi:hypothetical protein
MSAGENMSVGQQKSCRDAICRVPALCQGPGGPAYSRISFLHQEQYRRDEGEAPAQSLRVSPGPLSVLPPRLRGLTLSR